MIRIHVLKWIEVLFGCIVFIVIFLPRQEVRAACSFEITISSDKAQYFVFEPVFVYYQIKNTNDTAVCFVLERAKEFFNIRDQEGRGYPNTELSEYLFCTDTLQPNQALDGWEDIRERYRMDHAGSYVCFNDFRGCSSNVLDVEVIQPTGGEKEALTLFQEAYRLHWSCGDKSTEKWEEAFHTYKELAEKFPGSVYAPVALRLALARGNVIEDKRVVIGVAKKLIEEHPASPYLALGFLYLIDNYRLLHDKVGATKYMKELIAKYPGSEVSTRAEYWLDRIENLEF